MQFIRSFFKRITDDLKQKKLIPLKVLFFVHASTLFVLYPYLTIHMRELGINVEETAIMSAVTPVVSIVMPPMAGMLADKIGNFRCLLALTSALGGASALLLLAVPVGRITVTFPPAAELLWRCAGAGAGGDGGHLGLSHVHDYPCTPPHPYSLDVNLTTVSCGFVCKLPQELAQEEIDAIAYTHSYEVLLKSREQAQRLVYRHTMPEETHSNAPRKDQSTSRILTNNPFFNSSVSKVSDDEVFFPTPQLYGMDCVRSDTNVTCSFGTREIMSEETRTVPEERYRVRILRDKQRVADEGGSYWVQMVAELRDGVELKMDNFDDIESTMCKDNLVQTYGSKAIRVQVGDRWLTSCASACAVTAPRRQLCENPTQQIELDPAFTFWTYLAVRVFIGIIGGTAFAMFEGAVIAIVREQKADYGLQRLYGSIGGMISSPLSGLLIDYASRGKGYTDFRPAFYLYAVLKVASGVLMLSIDLEFKQPAQNLLEDVISVFRNIEIVALFIACFIMGTAWGYIESFLFWLLQDLGASRSLMGITITVGGVAGLPLLVLSGPIIRRLGHANVLFIGFIFYAIRLLGYSLIYNPWLCLLFEALESVTSSLSFTAAVTYAARLSSTTTDTSVQGLLGGLYYGVGKGAGSLIGGYLMKFFGTRPTYQIFAGATFITGCMYFLFNALYIRKRAVGDANDLCQKKPVTLDLERPEPESKEAIKLSAPIEVPSVHGTDKAAVARLSDVAEQIANKSPVDNIDGGSDSGVDNPAYNDTENSLPDLKRETVKAL